VSFRGATANISTQHTAEIIRIRPDFLRTNSCYVGLSSVPLAFPGQVGISARLNPFGFARHLRIIRRIRHIA
jgi:hypothetical protein